MEGSIMVEEHQQNSDSNIVSKPVGSSIKIDSISIDLVSANDKIDHGGKCEHFSIRGYVSEVCNKNWKTCWPFALESNHNKSEEQICMLPPLHVPKFRWWRCQNCLQEINAKGTENDNGTTFNSCDSTEFKCNGIFGDAAMVLPDFHQAAELNILEGRKSDANTSNNVNSDDNCHLSSDKKEEKVEVALSPFIGNEIGPADHVNQEIPTLTCAAAEVFSSLIQERCHTDDIVTLKTSCNGTVEFGEPGFESHEVADVEHANTNLECMVENSTEILELTGKQASADYHLAESMTACGTSGVAAMDDEAHPSPELDECDYASSESAEILVGKDLQDHHHDKSTGLHRRKLRKVRLLTELLGRNGDANIDLTRTEDSPSSAVPDDISSQVGTLCGPQGNVRRDFGQSRKRKLPLDEEWKPPLEMSFPNNVHKKLRTLNGGASTTEPIASSDLEEDVFTSLGLQTDMTCHWTSCRIDRSPITGQKKNEKAVIVDECLFLAPSRESAPKESQEKIPYASMGNAADSVMFKSAHAAFIGRGMDPSTFPAQKAEKNKRKGKMPQVDEGQASLIPWDNGMVIEGPITRNDVEVIQTVPVPVPFQSAQDASSEKGLQLSLNSYLATLGYDRNYIPQFEGRPASLLPWQEGSLKKDQVMRKDVKTNDVGDSSFPSKYTPGAFLQKGTNCNLSSKRSTYKMPFLNEKEKYTSQVEVRGYSLIQQMDLRGTSSNGKTVEIQDHSTLAAKQRDQRTNKASEQVGLDDIPMEIVELMAKNQYERCLPDAENDKHLLEKTNNTRKAQIMDFNNVYGNGELSMFPEEATQKRKPRAKKEKNAKITRDENVGPTKQKSVDHLAHVDRNQFNMSQLEPTYAPSGFRAFLQCQEKPSSGVQFSPTSSSRHTSAQNCQGIGDMVGHRSSHSHLQGLRGCNTCQTVSQQSEKAAQLWPSMIPNHMPFVYKIPQKCADQSTNIDVFSHCPSSLHKGNMRGDHDLKFLNQNTTNLEKRHRISETLGRTSAEIPFACKHNEIELQQKLMGSLDLYSNDTIPAMHLLSLMDAGLRSGGPINVDGIPKFLKRPSSPHDHHSKEISGLPSGGYKTTNTMKTPACNYYGKDHLSESSRGCFTAIPPVGASTFSFQHDISFKKATDFTGQVSLKSREKEKTKVPDSFTQNRGRKSKKSVYTSVGFGTNHGSIPVHSTQKMFLGAADPLQFPLQFHATKQKLESRSSIGIVWPLKSNSETEICNLNRNPADFSMPEAGNVYMIGGDDLKFGKRVASEKRSGLMKLDGHKRQRKLTAAKEHTRHRMS